MSARPRQCDIGALFINDGIRRRSNDHNRAFKTFETPDAIYNNLAFGLFVAARCAEFAQAIAWRELSVSSLEAPGKVPVLDHEDRILGIVSEGELMRRPESDSERHPSWWLALLAMPEEKARDYL